MYRTKLSALVNSYSKCLLKAMSDMMHEDINNSAIILLWSAMLFMV